MLIITLRTDKPEAEIGLYDDEKRLTYSTWEAHRKLAETLHAKIKEVLDGQGKSFSNLNGVVIYKGPGSFTGLRIGFSVANALADSIKIPIIAEPNKDWIMAGTSRIMAGENEIIAHPDYGSAPRVTTPRK